MGDETEAGQTEMSRKVSFTREFSAFLPGGVTAFVIPATEWNRVKRMIARITPAKTWFVVAGSICAGVGISAVSCLIGFASAKDVPTWAKAVSWGSLCTGVVLCIGLFYLDSQQRSDISYSTKEVLKEMEQLESHPTEPENVP